MYPSEPPRSVEAIIRSRGATPATVAILAGRPHVGLTPGQLEALAEAGPRARKCSRRDLAVAMAQVRRRKVLEIHHYLLVDYRRVTTTVLPNS